MTHKLQTAARELSRWPTRIETFLDRIATGPNAFVLFLLALSVLFAANTLDFPLSVPYMERISGQDYLDMQRFYTADRAYSLLEAFGPAGRNTQLLLLPTLDLLIPFLSGLGGAVMITFLFRNRRSALRLRWAALFAALSDYVENIGIFFLVLCYPARIDPLATLTGIVTAVKSFLYFIMLLTIVAGIVLQSFARLNRIQRGRV